MLIRIAICDDESEAITQHEDIVKNSLRSCGIGYEITTYTQGSNLLCDITDDNFFYDLLLLDYDAVDRRAYRYVVCEYMDFALHCFS